MPCRRYCTLVDDFPEEGHPSRAKVLKFITTQSEPMTYIIAEIGNNHNGSLRRLNNL